MSVIWKESGEAELVANRRIEPDEELCISYIDEGEDFATRQEQLAGYGFQCDSTCDRCRFDFDFGLAAAASSSTSVLPCAS